MHWKTSNRLHSMNTSMMDYPVLDRSFDEVSTMPPVDGSGVCEVLREAIEVLRDREEGFRQAAEHVTMEHLQSELLNYGGQRALFVSELQELERTYGKDSVDSTGTVSGALYRAWIGIKKTFTKRSN